jgi:aryl-alcohol dehydrogenase-like predicted oxidoreductase
VSLAPKSRSGHRGCGREVLRADGPDQVELLATTKGITVAQLAIAWSLTRGDDIVPLIGTSNPERLAQGVEATQVELTDEDLIAIETAMPADAAAGERYPAAQMAVLDSER